VTASTTGLVTATTIGNAPSFQAGAHVAIGGFLLHHGFATNKVAIDPAQYRALPNLDG